jgi:ATP-dependent Lon protease
MYKEQAEVTTSFDSLSCSFFFYSNSQEAGVPEDAIRSLVKEKDLHIHLPEGSVGKDGPSGGITLVVAIVSLLTQRMARTDTAMTGEITLSGTVLPVGGIKQKVLAAYRHNIKRVILPHSNFVRDLSELPESVRQAMEFIPVKHVMEVLRNALQPPRPAPPLVVAKL